MACRQACDHQALGILKGFRNSGTRTSPTFFREKLPDKKKSPPRQQFLGEGNRLAAGEACRPGLFGGKGRDKTRRAGEGTGGSGVPARRINRDCRVRMKSSSPLPCFFCPRLSICVTKLALYGTRLPPSRFCRNGKADPTVPYPTDQQEVFVTQRSLAQGLLSSWKEVRELRGKPEEVAVCHCLSAQTTGKKNPWQQSWGKGTTALPGRLAAPTSGGGRIGESKYATDRRGYWGDRGVPIRSYSLGPHRFFFESSCRFHLLHFFSTIE